MRALILAMLVGCGTARGQSAECTSGAVETRYECTQACGVYCGTFAVRQYECRGGMWVRQ